MAQSFVSIGQRMKRGGAANRHIEPRRGQHCYPGQHPRLRRRAGVGILVGDVLGVGHVGNGDIGNVQSHLGQQTDSSNFRDDVTIDGRINNQDVQTVRSYRGTFLP